MHACERVLVRESGLRRKDSVSETRRRDARCAARLTVPVRSGANAMLTAARAVKSRTACVFEAITAQRRAEYAPAQQRRSARYWRAMMLVLVRSSFFVFTPPPPTSLLRFFELLRQIFFEATVAELPYARARCAARRRWRRDATHADSHTAMPR